jgi:hypothetical protein
MTSFTVYHDDEVITVADQTPCAQAVLSAPCPLILGSHQFLPLLIEMFVQHRQGNVRQQRG